MTTTEAIVRPSDRALVRALASALGDSVPVTAIKRSQNPYTSWHPSDVVTCSAGSRGVEVLCKYDFRSRVLHGLPCGVSYEADAYRVAVEPSSMSAPRSFGLFSDEASGALWLMLEFVGDSYRLSSSPEAGAIVRAARWIGSFHRFHDRRGTRPAEPLNRHDEATFAACVRRALNRCEPLRSSHPWLGRLAREYQAVFSKLLLRRPTVIHGEFYPKNILVRNGTVFPVDWERAAISAGEIDLASLTEGDWDPEDVRLATDSYAVARWGADVPDDHAEALDAARIYLHLYDLGLRDLGDGPEEAEWRLQQLELAAARRDLL